jgi:hypothetical protein
VLCAGSPQAKYTTRGPRLIEVNSRMGGGQVRENNLAVWGVDLVNESLLSAIGMPNAPPVPDTSLTCRSALYFNAMRTGFVGKGDWLEAIRGLPGVVYAKLLVKEGDAVTCCEDGMPTWLGQLMCDGATPEEAMDRVKAYEKLVRPPIKPKSEGAMPTLYCQLPPVLAELDQSLLATASVEGQEYRLSHLRDRVLVFISAGYSGKKFIFEKAKELGVLSVIIDNPGTWSSELAITGTIKRFIPMDMEGPNVVENIVAALQGLNDEVRLGPTFAVTPVSTAPSPVLRWTPRGAPVPN